MEYPPKCITLDANFTDEKRLDNFVSTNTFRFFSITGLLSEFIKKNVAFWEKDVDYKTGSELVHSIRVVNDIVEQEVALMQEYNYIQQMENRNST